MGPDSSIVQCSKWKQFSLGINPKISPTLSGERASKRGQEEERYSKGGENQRETGKERESYLGRVFGD